MYSRWTSWKLGPWAIALVLFTALGPGCPCMTPSSEPGFLHSHLTNFGFKKHSAQLVLLVPGSASSSLAPSRFCTCGCESGIHISKRCKKRMYCNSCYGLLSPGCVFAINRLHRPSASSAARPAGTSSVPPGSTGEQWKRDSHSLNMGGGGKGSRSSGSNGYSSGYSGSGGNGSYGSQ